MAFSVPSNAGKALDPAEVCEGGGGGGGGAGPGGGGGAGRAAGAGVGGRLEELEVSPGRHTMHWDGRDDRGAPVASGLYHARLNINDWSATKRMLMVR